ncbi:uncharacterized protein LOC118477195 [Aplysia californica]|uniref:Uncharacterized protein LOC118477195 n=1 Tax=Aplysia californica TaxID=6500 RepID=A0ABM1W162_APLCA|nr:uncharacterized protein LOC118477195 [Aplysia californica]
MLTLSVFVILMASATVTSQAPEGYQQETEVNELKDQLAELKDVVAKLSRYAMMQQFSAEERVRSEGASGVNIVRGDTLGMYDYYTNTHVGHGMMAVHDHSNYDRTVGQGELVAVLNGVSFSTRHNDYRMVMASPNSTDFHAVQDVPFPGVPPQVTEKLTVPEQITEMQEWFKAFAEQNHTLRDYREYFKPVLCYLEGTWTINDKFKEPFHSDRHHLEAGSWEELTGKVRYSSYTGSKSRMENFAYLPTIMMSINETTGVPEYAQWNYRMLCSPLKEDVPLSDLRPVDDLSYRVVSGQSRDSILNSRRARFTFYEEDEKRFPQYTKLDRLFHTIPGLDNGPADLHQDSYGQQVLSMAPSTTDRPLNTGYYHRMFKSDRKGAMGIKEYVSE